MRLCSYFIFPVLILYLSDRLLMFCHSLSYINVYPSAFITEKLDFSLLPFLFRTLTVRAEQQTHFMTIRTYDMSKADI